MAQHFDSSQPQPGRRSNVRDLWHVIVDLLVQTGIPKLVRAGQAVDRPEVEEQAAETRLHLAATARQTAQEPARRLLPPGVGQADKEREQGTR